MALTPLVRDETLSVLGELLPDAAAMDREKLVARVSELAGEATREPPSSQEQSLLDQIQARVAELMD